MRDRWQACCGIVRVVLLGWLVRLAFFGVAMKGAVATVDMPRIFRGGGGTSERAAGGRAVVLVGCPFWGGMMKTMGVLFHCWGGRAATGLIRR